MSSNVVRDGHKGRFGGLERAGAEAGGQADPQIVPAPVAGLQLHDDQAEGVGQAQGPSRRALCCNFAHVCNGAVAGVDQLPDQEGLDLGAPVSELERGAGDHESGKAAVGTVKPAAVYLATPLEMRSSSRWPLSC